MTLHMKGTANIEGAISIEGATEIDEARLTRDDSIYLKLLDIHNANRIDYNTRKWETLKFFQGLYTALVTATVAGVIAAVRFDILSITAVRLIVAVLPLCGLISVVIGGLNLYRESVLLFMEEYQLFKICKVLGLADRELSSEQRWLACDRYLLLEKWRDEKYGTGGMPSSPRVDDWIKARMKRHAFLYLCGILFLVEAAMAVAISVIVIYLLTP